MFRGFGINKVEAKGGTVNVVIDDVVVVSNVEGRLGVLVL